MPFLVSRWAGIWISYKLISSPSHISGFRDSSKPRLCGVSFLGFLRKNGRTISLDVPHPLPYSWGYLMGRYDNWRSLNSSRAAKNTQDALKQRNLPNGQKRRSRQRSRPHLLPRKRRRSNIRYVVTFMIFCCFCVQVANYFPRTSFVLMSHASWCIFMWSRAKLSSRTRVYVFRFHHRSARICSLMLSDSDRVVDKLLRWCKTHGIQIDERITVARGDAGICILTQDAFIERRATRTYHGAVRQRWC